MKRITTLIILMIILNASGYSQTTQNDSARINKISGQLGIEKRKAKKLIEALHFNEAKINEIIKNSSLNPAEKQRQIKPLLDERETQISAVLSAAEKKRMTDTLAKKSHWNQAQFEAAQKSRNNHN